MASNILSNVITGVASAMAGERVREVVDPRKVNQEQPVENVYDVLCDIRRILQDQVAGRERNVVETLAYPIKLDPNNPYMIQKEGRRHMNLLCAAAFNLYIEVRGVGWLTKMSVAGWNSLELPDGGYLTVPAGDPVRMVYVEYADYMHGISI